MVKLRRPPHNANSPVMLQSCAYENGAGVKSAIRSFPGAVVCCGAIICWVHTTRGKILTREG